MSLKEEQELNILSADWVSGLILRLQFSDGFERTVDFEPFLASAVQPDIRKYLDQELFKGFSISYGNLIWNDYDLCFSIGDLYSGNLMAHSDSESMVAENVREYRSVKQKEE